MCTNQKYQVTASVSSTTTVTPTGNRKPPKGKKNGSITYWPGLEVKALIAPESVATITPTIARTALQWIGDDEIFLPITQAVFTVETKKAGDGTFSISVEVPDRITHAKNQVNAKSTNFRVVDCNYRITMTYKTKVGSSSKFGYYGAVRGWMENGKLRVDPETHQITGTGDVISSVEGGELFPEHSCLNKALSTANPAEALGYLENGLFKFELLFHRSTFTVTKQCKGTVEGPNSHVGSYGETERGSLFGSTVLNTLQGIIIAPDGSKLTVPINKPEYELSGEFIIKVTPENSSTQ